MKHSLEERFHDEMMGLYHRALEMANYRARYFLTMVVEHGGLETARILIRAENVSDGFTRHWERGNLELTVEAFIHDHPEYDSLFTPDEHSILRGRLIAYEYAPALRQGSADESPPAATSGDTH